MPPAKLLSSIAQAIPTKSKLFQNINAKTEAENYRAQNRYLGLENTETPAGGYTLVNISFNTRIRVFKENSIPFRQRAITFLMKPINPIRVALTILNIIVSQELSFRYLKYGAKHICKCDRIF